MAFPFNSRILQVCAMELIGDVLVEFKDLQNAIYYYCECKSLCERLSELERKIVIYRKLGNCHRLLLKHELALRFYKKMLQLAWYTGNTGLELDAYDNIGLEYYYLGDISRASYYHNRMMSCKVEPMSHEKAWSINMQEKGKLEKAYKFSSDYDSFFEKYSKESGFDEDMVLPHESLKFKLAIERKLEQALKRPKILSPKYEESNLKQNLYNEALKQACLEKNIFEKTLHIKKKANKYSACIIQSRAKMLLRNKLRIYNMSMISRYKSADKRTQDSSSRNTDISSGKKSPYSQTYALDCTPATQESTFCNYSHLGQNRARPGKSSINISGYYNIAKKIDEYGDVIIDICCNYLKESGVHSYVISTFKELAKQTKRKKSKPCFSPIHRAKK